MWRTLFCVSIVIAASTMGAAARDKGSFESPYHLSDTIVVAANRFCLPVEQSVWPVTVVTSKNLQSQSTLNAALEAAGGVDIRTPGGDGAVATLSNWGVFNRHMLLLYNGRVVKDYSLGGFNLSDFSLEEVERVEIVKGPQSAFYGSDAVGGVVNLMTPSALAQRLKISAQYGSLNYRKYHLDLARRIGAVGVGMFAEHAGTDNRRDNSGMQRTVIRLNSDYLSADHRHRLSVSARIFDDSLGVPGPVPDPAMIPVYGNSESSSLTSRQEDDHHSFDAQYRFSNDRGGEAQLDLFYERKNLNYFTLYNYQSYYATIDSSVLPADTQLNIDSIDVHSLSVYNKRSSGLSGRFMASGGVLTSAAGFDWLSGFLAATGADSSIGTNVAGPATPYSYSYGTHNFWAGRQNQFDLWGNLVLQTANEGGHMSRLAINLSGRLQFVRSRRTQPSYDVGLIFAPGRAVSVKLGHGYAFRLPTLAEQFADDVYTAGNARLDPETARTTQITLAGRSTHGTVTAEVTLFHQQINSLIQYSYNPTLYRSVPSNVELLRSVGIDGKIGWRVAPFVSCRFGGVLQRAQQTVDSGQSKVDAFYVPDLKWRFDLDWSNGRLSGNFSVVYTSERTTRLFDGSRKHLDKVYELGMTVAARLGEHLSLRAMGNDLTDERQPDQFGFTAADRDYPGLGRRVILEIRLSL